MVKGPSFRLHHSRLALRCFPIPTVHWPPCSWLLSLHLGRSDERSDTPIYRTESFLLHTQQTFAVFSCPAPLVYSNFCVNCPLPTSSAISRLKLFHHLFFTVLPRWLCMGQFYSGFPPQLIFSSSLRRARSPRLLEPCPPPPLPPPLFQLLCESQPFGS